MTELSPDLNPAPADLTPPPADQTPPSADLTPLRAELSDNALITDPDIIAAHAMDKALFCPVGTALGLVRATSVADVQATLRFAHQHRIPVVTQGARTGLSGGANAVDGCLLLSVAKLNVVLSIDPVEQICRVQPGVINGDLKQVLAPYGLAYPPDPGSVAISSIGGNVATNAGGMCCVKYGVTRDYVRALSVVLPDGTLTRLGVETAKGVAGLDLMTLFIGSEGTLGVIVEITLALVPAIPEPLTAVGLFADSEAAAATVCDFMAQGASPVMLEFMDKNTITVVNQYADFGLPADAGALLLVQSNGDGNLSAAEAELAEFSRLAHQHSALEVLISDDPKESELLVAARRAVAPAYEKYVSTRGGGELVDDVCIPRARMQEFFAHLDGIAQRFAVHVSTAGHAGDGNMHPAVLFDAADPDSTARAKGAFDAIMELGLSLGGTITGEHGVGYLKNHWLATELDDGAKRLSTSIKAAIDPQGILNPGKMLEQLG